MVPIGVRWGLKCSMACPLILFPAPGVLLLVQVLSRNVSMYWASLVVGLIMHGIYCLLAVRLKHDRLALERLERAPKLKLAWPVIFLSLVYLEFVNLNWHLTLIACPEQRDNPLRGRLQKCRPLGLTLRLMH